jgi:hypothetical protein
MGFECFTCQLTQLSRLSRWIHVPKTYGGFGTANIHSFGNGRACLARFGNEETKRSFDYRWNFAHMILPDIDVQQSDADCHILKVNIWNRRNHSWIWKLYISKGNENDSQLLILLTFCAPIASVRFSGQHLIASCQSPSFQHRSCSVGLQQSPTVGGLVTFLGMNLILTTNCALRD